MCNLARAVAVVVALTGAHALRADQAPPPSMRWNPVIVQATASSGDASAFLDDGDDDEPRAWCVDGDGVGSFIKLTFDRPISIDRVSLRGSPPFSAHEDFARPIEVQIANDANEKATAKRPEVADGGNASETFDEAALDGSPTKSLTITIEKAKPAGAKRTCLGGITLWSTTNTYDVLTDLDAKAVPLVTTSFASFWSALSSCDAAKLGRASAFPLEHVRNVAAAAGGPKTVRLETDIADASSFAALCRGYNSADGFPTASRKPLSFRWSPKTHDLTMQGRTSGDGVWLVTARFVDGAWRMVRVTR